MENPQQKKGIIFLAPAHDPPANEKQFSINKLATLSRYQ
jgi:hypothetical protein